MMNSDTGSSTYFITALFKGLAPKAGSKPASAMKRLAEGVTTNL